MEFSQIILNDIKDEKKLHLKSKFVLFEAKSINTLIRFVNEILSRFLQPFSICLD